MNDNLVRSEIVVAKILEKLLDAGLQDSWILSFPDLNLTDEYAIHFGASAKWLVAEGLIRVHGINDYITGHSRIVSPSLTSKGFSLLGQHFSVSGKTVPASEIVRDTANGKASYNSLGDFLGGVLGGFTKSIGS